MNNISLWEILYPQKLRTNRIYKIMKITLTLVFVSIFSMFAGNIHSQNARITFTKNNATLESVLNEIENQTDYLFIINSNIDTHQKVSVRADDTPVSKVLDELFHDTEIHYTMEGSHIVLSNKPQPAILQQTRKITGRILDENGEPLIGVSVMLKGTSNGTITNIDGDYTLSGDITDKSVLEVTYIGMKKQEITVGNRTRINITMTSDNEMLDEVIVVGYGTQKKVNLSGAVESVGGKTLANRATNSIGTMLQGIVPNLNISIGDGQANSVPTFNIRGETSINGGSPLIVIDGIPTETAFFSRMNSSDIESISVLKDASSAAIYGAKAAYGVILVTTKKGEKGEKINVDFDNSITVRKLGRMPKIVKDPYIQASYKKIMGKPWYDLYSDEDLKYIEKMKEDPTLPNVIPSFSNPEYYTYLGNTDWFSEIYDNTGITHSHNLSLSGASEKASYYIGMEYMQERGLLKINKDIMDRYNFRSKVDFKVADWLTFGNNTSALYYTYKRPSSFYSWLFNRINDTNTLMTVKNPDGSWTKEGAELIGSLSEGEAQTTELSLQSQFTMTLALIKNVLSIKADATARLGNRETEQWDSDMNIPYKQGPNLADEYLGWVDMAQLAKERDYYTSVNAYIDFTKSFGKHQVSALAGFNQEYNSHRYMRGEREELISSSLPSVELATGSARVREDNYEWATRGGFFRLNYIYNNKYIFEANGRYDGSSRFAKGNRWGFFPSGSVGWRISEEPFFKPLSGYVDNLKLRASFGSLGNQNVSSYYTYMRLISVNDFAGFTFGEGSSMAKYATLGAPVASDLTWETSQQWDFGFDLTMLKNRLNITVDGYVRNTLNMLTDGVELPAVYGASVPDMNTADLQTKGYEVTMSWRDQFELAGRPLEYSLGFNVSNYKSYITKYDNKDKTFAKDYYEGMRIGEIRGFVTDGLFATDEEAQAYAKEVDLSYMVDGLTGGWKAGDVKFVDLDGDGMVDIGSNNVADPGDRKVLGNSLPSLSYGINASVRWCGFDVSVFFQGTGNHYRYPHGHMMSFWGPFSYPYQTFLQKDFMDKVWAEDNTDAYFPRPMAYSSTSGPLSKVNDRYLQNIRYMRLKNLTVGYTIPVNLTKKIGIGQARFYFSGENLCYWSPLKKITKYVDPEGAISRSNDTYNESFYPWQKTLLFGVDITF